MKYILEQNTEKRLVLASTSIIRLQLLHNAGVSCYAEAALCDEEKLKIEIRNRSPLPSVQEQALELAVAKARSIYSKNAETWIIGADQMLVCNGKVFDKPKTLEKARQHLLAFRGVSHYLVSAVAVIKPDGSVWSYVDDAHLIMRSFSDDFLGIYLRHAGPDLLNSAGAYHLEGMGAQLFSVIEGNYFTILGLPLLPLLTFLRTEGIIKT